MQNFGDNKRNLLIFVLLFITVAAMAITIWALFFRTPDIHLVPDYAPVAEEEQARPIPGDEGEGATAQPGSGSVSLTYSDEIAIDLSGGWVELLFANPGRSNQDMVLQIVVQDTVILQSGRITPGNQITQLSLPGAAAAMLSPGGYEGMMHIFYYDMVSGEKAIVDTRIPVFITVTK